MVCPGESYFGCCCAYTWQERCLRYLFVSTKGVFPWFPVFHTNSKGQILKSLFHLCSSLQWLFAGVMSGSLLYAYSSCSDAINPFVCPGMNSASRVFLLEWEGCLPGMRRRMMFLGVHKGQDSHHLTSKVVPWGWPIVLMGAKVFCGFRS